jgi:hypothetical protein
MRAKCFTISGTCAFTLHYRSNSDGGLMRPLGVTLSAYFEFIRAALLAV